MASQVGALGRPLVSPPHPRKRKVGIELPVSLIIVLFYLLTFILPFFAAIFLAFNNWDFISNRVWVGLGNFERMLGDALWWNGLVIAFKFSITFMILGMASQLLLALFFYQLKGSVQKLMIALYFLPAITPWVAAIVVWRWLLWPTGGLINTTLRAVGLPAQPLISGNTQALYCIVVAMLWKWVGYGGVIFLAGLNEIPDTLYEAARIDGANWWHNLTHITLPLLQPILMLRVVTSVIGLLQTFEPFYLITQGGPGHSTRAAALYMYSQGFQKLNFGYASALSLVLFLILVILTLIQLRVMRTEWEY
jgi:multiple sugar transport system permease protein